MLRLEKSFSVLRQQPPSVTLSAFALFCFLLGCLKPFHAVCEPHDCRALTCPLAAFPQWAEQCLVHQGECNVL